MRLALSNRAFEGMHLGLARGTYLKYEICTVRCEIGRSLRV